MARKRLKELRVFGEERKKDEIQKRQTKEMEALENAHKQEVKELEKNWNSII